MSKRGDKVLAQVLLSNWFERRDGAILMSLYYRKVLDMDNVRNLHFDFPSGKTKAYQRVSKLENAGLVAGFWKYGHKFIMLTSAGAYYVAGQLGCDVKDLKYKLNPDQTIQNLEHYVGTNTVGIRLEQEGRRRGYRMKMFLTEPNVEYGKNKRFQPDAIGHLIHEKDMPFYLEYDRDTQTPKVFGETKVLNYQNGWRENAHAEHFDVFPNVLVVTEGDEDRANRLKSEVEKRLEAKILFMITTREKLIQEPYGSIWFVPGREGTFSLLQAGKRIHSPA